MSKEYNVEQKILQLLDEMDHPNNNHALGYTFITDRCNVKIVVADPATSRFRLERVVVDVVIEQFLGSMTWQDEEFEGDQDGCSVTDTHQTHNTHYRVEVPQRMSCTESGYCYTAFNALIKQDVFQQGYILGTLQSFVLNDGISF